MIPEFKKKIINELIKNKKNDLTFIHTPKCAGTYVSRIVKNLDIKNNHHSKGIINDGVNFTIIRNPVDRFESLLNYRLNENTPRPDWPKHLNYVYDDQNIDLDMIIENMSDEEITNFKPYNSLTFWSENIDIFLLIDELHEFLKIYGYDYNIDKYSKINVSKKNRGRINEKNKERITKLYVNDMKLFKKWTINE
jgi:hypothetical protein